MSAVKVMCLVLMARQSYPVNMSVFHESVGTSQSSLSAVTSRGTAAFCVCVGTDIKLANFDEMHLYITTLSSTYK